MTTSLLRGLWICPLVLVGCGDSGGGASATDAGTGMVTVPGTSGGPSSATESPTGTDGGTATGVDTSSETGFKFDIGSKDLGDTTGGPVGDACKVVGDIDAIGDCQIQAPPDSFSPSLQWSFGPNLHSMVTPLVGNFTDDNADGEIDLCDTPDVVFVGGVMSGYGAICEVFLLDGATGAQHFAIPLTERVSCLATPAFADIDGDGLPEIVALWNDDGFYRVKAFEHDGTPKWANQTDGPDQSQQFSRESGAIAIHDLDADGDAEIVFNHEVYDHDGVLLWEHPNPLVGELEASVGVDLDGDGMMEVVTGHSAYHHDGTVYWDKYPQITSQSIPQIANLDDDPSPEVFITSGQGLWMLEHDGAIKWGPETPTGVLPMGNYLTWTRPGTIHDFDGDGVAEYASSSRDFYAVYEGNPPTVLWQQMVDDSTGAAGGTAFDFLGDGVAEAMYADEQNFRIYDGMSGQVLLTQARSSSTVSEYPTVADVDNDGSAEILVVSLSITGQPALQVLRDTEDRWIQARRIWNQHAYYVTNIREDGTLPVTPVTNWEIFNTFRTQAQIEGGGLCMPEPPG